MNREYVRIAIYDIDQVLPFVFTKEKRFALKKIGADYTSYRWKLLSSRSYPYYDGDVLKFANVAMGSHRYELFVQKGITCVECGIEGKYFALERGAKDNPNRFHFNLYGLDSSGGEVLITKDHVIPRSAGGKNKMSNYQTMCFNCNKNKANRVTV